MIFFFYQQLHPFSVSKKPPFRYVSIALFNKFPGVHKKYWYFSPPRERLINNSYLKASKTIQKNNFGFLKHKGAANLKSAAGHPQKQPGKLTFC
ncbi:hypothetical protein ACT3CD_16210 [Geofilum sp. OHC36d9]|uniref:hypothetical protein n=1 Tax=Geofilum sp. OHC36d9 TaxID=3458413 RepID=UPI0040342168